MLCDACVLALLNYIDAEEVGHMSLPYNVEICGITYHKKFCRVRCFLATKATYNVLDISLKPWDTKMLDDM